MKNLINRFRIKKRGKLIFVFSLFIFFSSCSNRSFKIKELESAVTSRYSEFIFLEKKIKKDTAITSELLVCKKKYGVNSIIDSSYCSYMNKLNILTMAKHNNDVTFELSHDFFAVNEIPMEVSVRVLLSNRNIKNAKYKSGETIKINKNTYLLISYPF